MLLAKIIKGTIFKRVPEQKRNNTKQFPQAVKIILRKLKRYRHKCLNFRN